MPSVRMLTLSLCTVLLSSSAALGRAECAPVPLEAEQTALQDFAFILWTDTHFDGFYHDGIHDDAVTDMNRLGGTEMPLGLGTVPPIDFVLHAGDITNHGDPDQWDNDYPATDTAFLPCITRLLFPVYEVRGNHDEDNDQLYVANGIMQRHSSLYYSFDYGGFHFIGMDCARDVPPAGDGQWNWLAEDLSRNGPTRPVILWEHHPVTIDAKWNPLQDALEGHNVAIILTGHTHHYARYSCRGYECWSGGHNVRCVNTWSDDLSGFTVLKAEGNWLRGAHYLNCEDRWETDAWVDLYVTGRTADPTPTPVGDTSFLITR